MASSGWDAPALNTGKHLRHTPIPKYLAPEGLVPSLLQPGAIVPIFRDRKPTQEMKPPTLKRERRNYSSAKQSCLWAQTPSLLREMEEQGESCRAQVITCIRYMHVTEHRSRYAGMCTDTPWTLPSLPVPRHNHGTHVVQTMVEVTSAAPTMGLTLT